MRPVGTTTADSTVSNFNAADQGGDDRDKAAAGGVEMVGDREGAEEFYDGDTEVSSQCCGGLSPTTIVYMSAFVSSLTSVLLGYGECAGVCVCARGRAGKCAWFCCRCCFFWSCMQPAAEASRRRRCTVEEKPSSLCDDVQATGAVLDVRHNSMRRRR